MCVTNTNKIFLDRYADSKLFEEKKLHYLLYILNDSVAVGLLLATGLWLLSTRNFKNRLFYLVPIIWNYLSIKISTRNSKILTRAVRVVLNNDLIS